MATSRVRAEILYAWKGSSLLIVTPEGRCDPVATLSGFYCREARFLRTLRVNVNGDPPWLCESAQINPSCLAFAYAHPELTSFGGGGTGQSGDEESRDAHGLAHRSLAIAVGYTVRPRGLTADISITNHARRLQTFDVAIDVGADFVDIQDVIP